MCLEPVAWACVRCRKDRRVTSSPMQAAAVRMIEEAAEAIAALSLDRLLLPSVFLVLNRLLRFKGTRGSGRNALSLHC